jgi:hypothetical protein
MTTKLMMPALLLTTVALLAMTSAAHATGWYLLMPLMTTDGRAYPAPLSSWTHYASYATASECEQARVDYQTVAANSSAWADLTRRRALEGLQTESQAIAILSGQLSQCVATDDPRLAGREILP